MCVNKALTHIQFSSRLQVEAGGGWRVEGALMKSGWRCTPGAQGRAPELGGQVHKLLVEGRSLIEKAVEGDEEP